jgi:putative addiction module killer protein
MRYTIEKTDDVDDWLNSQKIKNYKNRLLARFERIKNGNFGDFKPITDTLFELRFFFGNALRVYYTFKNDEIVLLLIGGDKSSQTKDIEKAKQIIEDLE